MRIYILGTVLFICFIHSYTSPIGKTLDEIEQTGIKAEETTGVTNSIDTTTEKLKETARQSEDDDDDDDDDDLGLDLDDDDDDDDDDDETDDDDDDGDYDFDSFFDDILGGDDDDDDDDEGDDDDIVEADAPAPAPIQPVVPAASEAVVEETPDEAIEEHSAGGDAENENGTAVENAESLIDKNPTESSEPVVVEEVPANDNEDDDDDDDDDDLDLTDDDDDDDDDDADDDDDDDDDTDLDDVIEAKRSRAMQTPKMPAIYISKYNRFVDNIINRINHILGKSYDPVRVKLLSNEAKKNTGKKRKSTKPKATSSMTNKMAEISIARAKESESREASYILIAKSNKKRNNKKKKANTKNRAPRAKATLFGLSSIRRDGDVSVNMMADHTNVKTNFIIGPLTLRVEREMGRGAKREVKSATATTAEMHGRLNLKIVHGGAATLHSIKVLQPKQVRVDSSDDHDKTKEFMWRRSPHIASLVSQKLASATRSMLQPPPVA